jgi:hypothetical protein
MNREINTIGSKSQMVELNIQVVKMKDGLEKFANKFGTLSKGDVCVLLLVEERCGNTTVSHLVAEELGYPMINFTFRTLSEEKGIEFWTFCRMAEESDEFDLEVDRRQVEMALAQPNCVLGSRWPSGCSRRRT